MSDLLHSLRALLQHYSEPCAEECEHSQCPLLRELHSLAVKATLDKAQVAVSPVTEIERQGEEMGDVMSLGLRTDGLLDFDLDPFRGLGTSRPKEKVGR